MHAIEVAVLPVWQVVVHQVQQLSLLCLGDEVLEQGLARQRGMGSGRAHCPQKGLVA